MVRDIVWRALKPNVDDDDADGWAITSDADDEERSTRALPRDVRRVRDAVG